MIKEKVIFDFDHTLINCNSTLEFIKYVLSKKKFESLNFFAKYIIFTFVYRLYPFIFRFFKDNKFFLISLRGVNELELSRLGESFFKEFLRTKTNKSILEIFRNTKEPIVVSSGLKEVLNPFCKKYSCRFHSSELEYDKKRRFTGKVSINLTGNKFGKIKNELNTPTEKFIIYTDNREDYPLKKNAKQFFAIANSLSDKVFWENKEVSIIKNYGGEHLSLTFAAVPLLYYLRYRVNKVQFLIYHFLFFTLVLFLFRVNFNLVLYFFLGWIGYVSFYELGYFMNDIYSIRREKNPSLRIKSPSRKIQITFILTHLFVGTFLSIVLTNYVGPIFLILNFGVLGVFIFHNILSQNKRFFSYLILKTSHYVVPFSIIFYGPTFFNLSMIVLVFQIPKYFFEYLYKHNFHKKPSNNFFRRLLIIQICIFVIGVFFFKANLSFTILAGFFLLFNFLNYFIKQTMPQKDTTAQ